MKVKHLADEKHKSIGILKSSRDVLKQKISDLSAKREALLVELCLKLNKKKASYLKRSRLSNRSETSKLARHCR